MSNVYFNNPYGGTYAQPPIQAPVQMPQQVMYAAPMTVQPDQTTVNVNAAKGAVQGIINMLTAQRMLTPAEVNLVVANFNNPVAMQRFAETMARTLGAMPYSQDYINNAVSNFIMNAVQSQRARQPAPGMIQYGATPQPMPACPSTAYGVTGVAANQDGTKLTMDVYGSALQGTEATLAKPPAPNQKNPQARTINTGLTSSVSVPNAPTNTVYNIPVQEEIMPRPTWSSNLLAAIDTQEPTGEALRYAAFKVGIMPETDLDVAVWRVKTPVVNTGDIIHVIDNAKRVQGIESQVDVVDFDMCYFLGTPTNSSTECYRKARHIYQTDKNISGVIKTLQHLDGSGDTGRAIENVILTLFNQASSVNFVRLNARGGVERFAPVTTSGDLNGLFKNNGQYEIWKKPDDRFINALKNTIESSFGRALPRVSEGYMKLTRADLRDIVLVKYYNELGIEGGIRTIMAKERTPQEEADITSKLANAFTMRIERKVIIHRLEIPHIPESDKTLHTIDDQLARYLVGDFYTRFGNAELVDPSDPTQYSHPLRIGALYDGIPIVRRM